MYFGAFGSAAWVAFAKTGNPAHGGLPAWPAFNTTTRPTMVLGPTCALVNDLYGDERRALAALRARTRAGA